MSSLPRISRTQYEILDLLRSNGEMYGLEMVRASSMLKRGTVYVLLDRMSQRGWVRSRADAVATESGLPRRRYSLSAEGQRVLIEYERRLPVGSEVGGAVL